jgi:hypothetical protein
MSTPAPVNLNLTINCTDSCNGLLCCFRTQEIRDDDIVIYNASDGAFEIIKRPRGLARLVHSKRMRRLNAETLNQLEARFLKLKECVACRDKECPGPYSCTRGKAKPLTKKRFEELVHTAALQLQGASESDVDSVETTD